MTDKICSIRDGVLKQKPLIHCITNPISINPCANAILSLGGRPMMAEHPKEVCEITDTAAALMLNMGNITETRMESMILSIGKAKEKGIPVLLDAVGVACSKFRRAYVLDLLKRSVPSVIKGNYSEIMALEDAEYTSSGVDAESTLLEETVTKSVKKLAQRYQTVILATGETDIVADGESVIYVQNGTPALAMITGTGCMLGAICSVFMTSASPMDAAVSACIYFGICGELSETKKGTGSFMVNLMDRISTLQREEILEHMKMEEKQ